MYSALINEYVKLLSKKEELQDSLSTLPKGYISNKKINGKDYKYLQTRKNDKIVSYYVKTDEAEYYVEAVTKRKECEQELPAINKRLKEVEQAAEILNPALSRKLMLLKLCSGMDSLSVERKRECFSFSDTMTSIEGVAVGTEVRKALNEWVDGKASILSIFEATLLNYGIDKEITL